MQTTRQTEIDRAAANGFLPAAVLFQKFRYEYSSKQISAAAPQTESLSAKKDYSEHPFVNSTAVFLLIRTFDD